MMLNANWIEPPRDFGNVSPLFLREFKAAKPVAKAVLRASARGVYEAVLNGKRVGGFVMAPGWTAYQHRIQVQEYDVTGLLKEDNTLTLQLANGWFGKGIWRGEGKDFEEPCGVIAELKLCYTDGTEDIIGTDGDWLVSESGLRCCDIYNGMVYDATLEPVFQEHAAVSAYNDRSKLIPQIGEDVVEQERLKPIAVIRTPKGETVIDFGQNMTGYLEITVDAGAGDKVSFSFAEILDKDGNFYNENYRRAQAQYEYICRDGLQTYKPHLTFYGFRYVRVDAYPGEITPENFTAIVVHSRMRRTGWIETSEPMLNQLFHNVVWGQKGNYLDVPTDCPQRDERLGWTGDAQVFVKTASYNYDVRKFFRKWLEDMKLEQKANGAVPCVIPAMMDRLFSAAWADAVTICPWQMYMTYGDEAFLEQMFEPMKKWVDYITATTLKPHLWVGGEHYGDWLALGGEGASTRNDLLASAFYAHSASLVCKAGHILGEDVSVYEKLHKDIVAAFRAEYQDIYYTQTEHVLALVFDLTEEPEKVAGSLVELIHKCGDCLQTGFVGTPYLLHVLSRFGHHRLAYTLLLRRDFPSWLYPVTKGATTMWEHWDGITEEGDFWNPNMNSFNHYAYGAVADWMYEVCAGIQPVEEAPGFARVHFAPIADDRIDRFGARIDTVHGTVSSKWYHKDGKVVYEITTPVPATALIEGKPHELIPGTYVF